MARWQRIVFVILGLACCGGVFVLLFLHPELQIIITCLIIGSALFSYLSITGQYLSEVGTNGLRLQKVEKSVQEVNKKAESATKVAEEASRKAEKTNVHIRAMAFDKQVIDFLRQKYPTVQAPLIRLQGPYQRSDAIVTLPKSNKNVVIDIKYLYKTSSFTRTISDYIISIHDKTPIVFIFPIDEYEKNRIRINKDIQQYDSGMIFATGYSLAKSDQLEAVLKDIDA
ncbi:hypothetical protein OZX62_05150 [Bifidobacterium sp. ESL0690]|uniref:hypothetical protein n=1 Tax=Bifidobacterium sp. ESL0690 TaxID=2983214 RepID=UPI0023FA4337|nr:hypothetical protein [Bifidobacterium sp. ESL0690]WEV47649.1 hypothetical protein OZX62_05150 [Bifidobacterium sp. ESL0690]